MSKTLHRVVTAFMINNDTEDVRNSIHKVLEMAEKSKDDVTQKQWKTIKCDMEQMDFLLKAISFLSQKIFNRFNVRMRGKSREEWKKEIDSLNRALYSDQ